MIEIIKDNEIGKVRRTNWYLAKALQKINQKKPSEFLVELSIQHIYDKITYEEIVEKLKEYYNENKDISREQKIVDFSTVRITEFLLNSGFSLSITHLKLIHRQIFQDIFDHAGEFRTYNIRRHEDLIYGESLTFADFRTIEELLEHDISKEKNSTLHGANNLEDTKRIMMFTSDLWLTQPFCEGNTITIAIFLLQYLRTLGIRGYCLEFNLRSYPRYFKEALLIANYSNFKNEIVNDYSYLFNFFNDSISRYDIIKNKDIACNNFNRDSLEEIRRLLRLTPKESMELFYGEITLGDLKNSAENAIKMGFEDRGNKLLRILDKASIFTIML